MATTTTTEGHQVRVVEEVEVVGDPPTIRPSRKEHISLLLFLTTLFNFYLIEKQKENIFGYVLIAITRIGHCVPGFLLFRCSVTVSCSVHDR